PARARPGPAPAAVLEQSAAPARPRAVGARLVASGGTATALAALDLGLREYAPARVHGHPMSRAGLAALAAGLATMPASVRNALPGVDPGRGVILPAGAGGPPPPVRPRRAPGERGGGPRAPPRLPSPAPAA